MQIFLFEPITDFTQQSVIDQIRNDLHEDDEEIELHINSPGGDVFVGFAISNLLKGLPNRVTSFIDGLAGSIASFIALNVDQVNISEAGSIMIHNASVGFGGNKELLQSQIDFLGKIDGIMADLFMAKTGLSEQRIIKLMQAESIFTAKEAVKLGFADKIVNKLKAVAFIDFNKMEEKTSLLDKFNSIAKMAGLIKTTEKEKGTIDELVKANVKEAQKEVTEKIKTSEGADLLTAKMVTTVDYTENKNAVNKVLAAFVEYVQAQPTEEGINKRIDAKVEERLTALLKSLESKAQAPKPLAEFQEKTQEKTDIQKSKEAYAGIAKKQAEIKEKTKR